MERRCVVDALLSRAMTNRSGVGFVDGMSGMSG